MNQEANSEPHFDTLDASKESAPEQMTRFRRFRKRTLLILRPNFNSLLTDR